MISYLLSAIIGTVHWSVPAEALVESSLRFAVAHWVGGHPPIYTAGELEGGGWSHCLALLPQVESVVERPVECELKESIRVLLTLLNLLGSAMLED